MNSKTAWRSLRGWSWLTAIASLLLPAALYFMQMRGLHEAARHREGYVSDASFLTAVAYCAALAAVLSALAMLLGGLAYRSLPRPRPVARAWEAVLVGGVLWLQVLALCVFAL